MNDLGHDMDEYDALNPLCVIWEDVSGRHAGSMRLMPTTGRCMVNEHFTDLLGGVAFKPIYLGKHSVLSFGQAPQNCCTFDASAGEVMLGCGVEQCLGVFDQRMIRIYRLLECFEFDSSKGQGKEFIGISLLTLDVVQREQICQIAGVEPRESAQWFDKYKSTQSELLIIKNLFWCWRFNPRGCSLSGMSFSEMNFLPIRPRPLIKSAPL